MTFSWLTYIIAIPIAFSLGYRFGCLRGVRLFRRRLYSVQLKSNNHANLICNECGMTTDFERVTKMQHDPCCPFGRLGV